MKSENPTKQVEIAAVQHALEVTGRKQSLSQPQLRTAMCEKFPQYDAEWLDKVGWKAVEAHFNPKRSPEEHLKHAEELRRYIEQRRPSR